MNDLESKVQAILERNQRVELEKAWEVSLTRRAFILATTYLMALLFLWLLGVPYFYLHALVPTGGYLLSTLSLPWIKKKWIQRFYSFL
jgi:hypothetical protein